MESGEKSRNGHKETLLYLDFNDKIAPELLDEKIFIRIANLEDKNPLVQINDMVFKGRYEYSIGTNLFFKKTSNQGISEFPFQQPITFDLEYLDAQTKILNCKQMKVPPTTAALPENNDKMQYNFKWDYEELLNKFEQGTLDLKDMVLQTEHRNNEPPQKVAAVKSNEDQQTEYRNNEPPQKVAPVKSNEDEALELAESTELNTCENVEMTENIEIIDVIDMHEETYPELKIAYENLQMLARTPVKRKSITEAVECDLRYRSSYEYKSIECKVLEPAMFSYFQNQGNFDKYNVCDCVDINRCVRLGILAPSNNFPRTLTENEKKMVLTMENFENLSLTARYSVLKTHLLDLEKLVNSSTSEENSKQDEFGHTLLETLDIFKKLLLSLQRRIHNVF